MKKLGLKHLQFLFVCVTEEIQVWNIMKESKLQQLSFLIELYL